MHIPDGLVNGPTSLGAAAVAAGGLVATARGPARTGAGHGAGAVGAVAGFVFAAQMVNYPVAHGTSGHLVGAALAAVVLGPRLGVVCLAAVLAVQAVVFADGGLGALGLNVVNMSLIAVPAGWAAFTLARRVRPGSATGVVAASAVAACVSVLAAAAGFVVEHALGGSGAAPVAEVATAMLGVHLLIGLGEAVVTAAAVGVLLVVRPDVVAGARAVGHAGRPGSGGPGGAFDPAGAGTA